SDLVHVVEVATTPRPAADAGPDRAMSSRRRADRSIEQSAYGLDEAGATSSEPHRPRAPDTTRVWRCRALAGHHAPRVHFAFVPVQGPSDLVDARAGRAQWRPATRPGEL